MAYEFLKDEDFLKSLDTLHIKEQYAKITTLSWDEEPIKEIQGLITGGSINIDGNSSIRRSCSLTMFAEETENDLSNITNIVAINKKVRVELGIVNTVPNKVYHQTVTKEINGVKVELEGDIITINYKKLYGDIIWFPLGVFVIAAPSLSHSLGGVTISLSLKDKMCLLDGSMGGVIPAATDFDILNDERPDNEEDVKKIVLAQIIRECVNHFGHEDLDRIIIEDVPDEIKQVVSSNSDTPYYLHYGGVDEQGRSLGYRLTFKQSEASGITTKFERYDDVGYVFTDFTYPGELTVDAGGCVTDVLDAIIKILGNYEYFYDVFGNFHFREIKNYLNMSQSWTWETKDYYVDLNNTEAGYIFDGGVLVQAFQNSPNYENVKNDFVVWGKHKSTGYPLRYHLAIDEIPQTGTELREFNHKTDYSTDHDYDHAVVFYKKAIDSDIVYATAAGCEPNDSEEIKNGAPAMWRYDSEEEFPTVGNVGEFYSAYNDGNQKRYLCVATSKTAEDLTTEYINDYVIEWVCSVDYREELYYQTLEARLLGEDAPYYGEQLVNEWPKLWDFKKNVIGTRTYGGFRDEQPYDYYLEIIDANASSLGQYGINQIGRRSRIQSDDDINCLFESNIPDVCYINTSALDKEDRIAYCQKVSQPYCQVSDTEYSYLVLGGSRNGCYPRICDLLYQHTSMTNTVSMTTLPMFWLDVNTRVTIKDDPAGIYGDYIITSISCPLGHGDMMNINAYRFYDKI